MTETTQTQNKSIHASNKYWLWMLNILIYPRRVFEQLSKIQNGAWKIPMLVLSMLVILLSLSGSPARLQHTIMNLNQPPDDFMHWSPEQQNQFTEGQLAMQGPLFITVFPLISSLAGLWLGWFLLGSILHLLMTLKGARQSRDVYFNFAAWAAVPFALRSLVQIISLLSTKQIIDDPGLSGLISQQAGGWLAYLRLILETVDL